MQKSKKDENTVSQLTTLEYKNFEYFSRFLKCFVCKHVLLLMSYWVFFLNFPITYSLSAEKNPKDK